MYTVFIRNWYKWEYDHDYALSHYGSKRLIPHAGRKTILARCNSEDQARAICKHYNDNHNPGVLSRKAEYIS